MTKETTNIFTIHYTRYTSVSVISTGVMSVILIGITNKIELKHKFCLAIRLTALLCALIFIITVTTLTRTDIAG